MATSVIVFSLCQAASDDKWFNFRSSVNGHSKYYNLIRVVRNYVGFSNYRPSIQHTKKWSKWFWTTFC